MSEDARKMDTETMDPEVREALERGRELLKEATYAGYRVVPDLEEAFARVRNIRDWKAPIDAVVPESERGAVQAAVVYYTATIPVFLEIEGQEGLLRVVADGYRMGPAGP